MGRRNRRLGVKARKRHKLTLLRRSKKCHYCGKHLGKSTATLDHVIPRCKGGTNRKDNLVLCCQPCNQRKDSLSKEQFLSLLAKELGTISKKAKRKVMKKISHVYKLVEMEPEAASLYILDLFSGWGASAEFGKLDEIFKELDLSRIPHSVAATCLASTWGPAGEGKFVERAGFHQRVRETYGEQAVYMERWV